MHDIGALERSMLPEGLWRSMREGGLEPPRLAAPDPKSGASAIPPLSRAGKTIEMQRVFEGGNHQPLTESSLTWTELGLFASDACKTASFTAASCSIAESVIA